MIDKFDAIDALHPNCQYVRRGDELEWLDTGQSEPTEAEITAKIAELEADYTAKQYQRDRAVAYPSIADQLDQIYHDGIDAWKETIAAVKAEYPKP